MKPSPDEPWTGFRPEEVRTVLDGLDCPWWMCGGWAIDLWLGRETRRHADTDVGCFRGDAAKLCAHLSDWDIFAAESGVLSELPAGPVPPDVSSLWCRRSGGATWDVQVMIEECDDRLWYFRRDPGVSRPRAKVTWPSESGMDVLRPEIQLLYKAKDPRPRDEADFAAVLPFLDAEARRWLRSALDTVHAGHRWLDELRGPQA